MSVVVHTKNGAVYEGILHTCKPEAVFAVVLKHAIQVKPGDGVTQATGMTKKSSVFLEKRKIF